MLQHTNMNGVKSVARALLMTEIHKTEFSPMIVQHPFTNSGITAIVKDGEVQPLDITENDNILQAWQNYVTRLIDQAEKPYDIYMMINKPYGLSFLRYASSYLSREDFSEILSDAWIRSENPNSDPNLTKRQLLRMFEDADPAILMSPEERKQLDTLDDTVTIYRGVTSHNKTIGRALSWTLNQKTAEWFAHRFKSAGFVYQAQVDKKNIIALFNGRNESEIIVDPKNLPIISQAEENTNQEEKPMTRLQQEVARRAAKLGCTTEYNEQDGSMQIIYDGAKICRLHSDDNYTYKDGEHQTEEHENVFYKVESLIDNCKEYISVYDKAQPFEIDGIKDYHKLAEFNGVVLGAKDMGNHGFQFSSWFLTYGGTGATLGNYSMDYDDAKATFAERSGLVDKTRQFSNEQLEDVYRCLGFTKDMNGNLTYDQEHNIINLMENLENVLPYLKDNPDYAFEPEEDSGMTMQ